uniref:Uncharacterized protein n=1 Tax=Salix viminalis TaxID=40686 RepID=A0A6N2KPX7_SALVM
MESCNRPVVRQSMVPAHDTKANDMPFIVKDFEALGALRSWETRDDVDLTEGTHVTVPEDDVAALDEMFIGLRVVEVANDGPHSGDRGSDLLHHSRAALVGAHRVGVVARDGFWDRGGGALMIYERWGS